MNPGIIIFAIVLCLSLITRLLIASIFSHRVFNNSSSMPLQRGIIPPSPDTETNNAETFSQKARTQQVVGNKAMQFKSKFEEGQENHYQEKNNTA